MSAEHVQSMNVSQNALPWSARWLHDSLQALECGRLTLVFDDGRKLHVHGQRPGPDATWHLHRPARLVQRMLRAGLVGFAEGYHAGDWSSPDLSALLYLGVLNTRSFEQRMQPGWLRRMAHRLIHRLRPNSRKGSRKNIAAHYDLGNDFYRLWLDDSMTYSSAIGLSQGLSLQQGQSAKYQRLLDLLQAHPEEHLLEIGCGWGGLAEAAAKRGLHVHGITLSQAQLEFAQARINRLGMNAMVDLSLTDYRDVSARFDHIVSIEMFEAVGEKYWPSYFQSVFDRLRPGGRAAIQVIVIDEAHYAEYRREPDYIQLFIFPGGMLPTRELFLQGAQQAGLEVRDVGFFDEDYARTLAQWRTQFEAQHEAVSAMGFDEVFQRMWSYYLAYCEVGFRSGRVHLMQVLLQKPAIGVEDTSCASP